MAFKDYVGHVGYKERTRQCKRSRRAAADNRLRHGRSMAIPDVSSEVEISLAFYDASGKPVR